MTIKEMFKKVEAYNEIAEIMGTTKAQIYFAAISGSWTNGEHFKTYEEFRKYIRREYFKEPANMILNADGWQDRKEVELEYAGRIATYEVEITVA